MTQDYHYKNLSPDSMDGEEWHPVEGYGGLYSISSLGRVLSERTGRIMRQQVKKNQRGSVSLQVNFCMGGNIVAHKVPTLVGAAFIGQRGEGECYSHKNKDPLDNRACNMERVTYLESVRKSYSLGKGTRSTRGKPHIVKGMLEPIFIRESDGERFRKSGLFKEYGRNVAGAITKAISDGRDIYGSTWSKEFEPVSQ